MSHSENQVALGEPVDMTAARVYKEVHCSVYKVVSSRRMQIPTPGGRAGMREGRLTAQSKCAGGLQHFRCAVSFHPPNKETVLFYSQARSLSPVPTALGDRFADANAAEHGDRSVSVSDSTET